MAKNVLVVVGMLDTESQCMNTTGAKSTHCWHFTWEQHV